MSKGRRRVATLGSLGSLVLEKAVGWQPTGVGMSKGRSRAGPR